MIRVLQKQFQQEKINKAKIKNSVGSTFFDKLKDDEKNNGFIEAVPSKNNKEKIPFFNLGPDNDWKKILFMMCIILMNVGIVISNLLVLGTWIINHGKFKKKFQ